MAEPWRRRLRARLLRAATRHGARVPAPLARRALALLARGARLSRYGERARANLAAAFGEELDAPRREEILRGVFAHSAALLSEWLRLARGAHPDRGEGAWIEELVEVDASVERLEAVLARGRGLIVATAHLGNWELCAAALRRRGLGGAVVGLRRPRDPSFDWLVEMRRAYGVETLPQDAPPRRLLEVLARGETIGVLADLEVRRLDGIFVPFLGRPALAMTAPAALARARGTPLVPVRCIAVARDPRRYRLLVDEPLEFRAELGRREGTEELTRRLAARFEAWIRQTPEQWAWHQDRWRTRPDDYDAVPLVERRRRTRAARGIDP